MSIVFWSVFGFSVVCAILARYFFLSLYRWAKPIPLFLLISWVVWHSATLFHSDLVKGILVGLVFSLLGDLFLLSASTFLIGLISFLLGHLAYMVAFGPPFGILPWYLYAPLAVVAVTYAFFLVRGLQRTHQEKYIGPVVLYLVVITLMVCSAWGLEQTILGWVSLGALLFMLSDAVLAWDKFLRSFFSAQLIILTTYYSAQAALVFGSLKIARAALT